MNNFIYSKEFKKLRWVLHKLAIVTAIIGGCLFAFKIADWRLVITIAGFIYFIQQFLEGFDPLHEMLDWTIVYPSLKGLQDEDVSVELEPEKKLEAAKEKQLKLEYLRKQLIAAEEYLGQM